MRTVLTFWRCLLGGCWVRLRERVVCAVRWNSSYARRSIGVEVTGRGLLAGVGETFVVRTGRRVRVTPGRREDGCGMY